MLDFVIFAVCFLSTLLIAIIWLYPVSFNFFFYSLNLNFIQYNSTESLPYKNFGSDLDLSDTITIQIANFEIYKIP